MPLGRYSLYFPIPCNVNFDLCAAHAPHVKAGRPRFNMGGYGEVQEIFVRCFYRCCHQNTYEAMTQTKFHLIAS